MKLLIPLLFLASLMQTSFLPINLCVVILICQSYLYEDRANYFLAFIGGLLLAVLSPINIGFWPLVFLIIVKISHLVRKLPIVPSLFTVPVLAGVILVFLSVLEQFLFNKSFDLKEIIWGVIVSLPIYFLLQIWQERLFFRNDIKLRIKNK